jgi:hypothetical protein
MPDQPCNQVSRRSVRGPAGFVDGCEAAARLALCRGCAESWRAFHAGETIYRGVGAIGPAFRKRTAGI